MKAFVFASLDCVAFISQGRHVESTSRIYSSFKCSHIFLAIRRALNDSKRLLSFPWATWHAFERERKMIEMERGGGGGGGGGGEGGGGEGEGTILIFSSHANTFTLPFRRPATQTIFFSW